MSKKNEPPAHLRAFGKLIADVLVDAGLKAAQFNSGGTVKINGGGFMVQPQDNNAIEVVAMQPPFKRHTSRAELAILNPCLPAIRAFLKRGISSIRAEQTVRLRPRSRTLSRAVVVTVPTPAEVWHLKALYDQSSK